MLAGCVDNLWGGGEGRRPSRKTMVRVRFWIDSSMTSERTSIMAFDCSSENPSSLRRCTNFRVSKWWSRERGIVVEKGLWKVSLQKRVGSKLEVAEGPRGDRYMDRELLGLYGL